jgi:hypothetical protein
MSPCYSAQQLIRKKNTLSQICQILTKHENSKNKYLIEFSVSIKQYTSQVNGNGKVIPVLKQAIQCNTSAHIPNGGECLASYSGCFIPGEGANGIHWTEGWVNPRTGLDAMEKRLISFPAEN